MFGSYSPAAASLSTVSHAANTPASPPSRPSRLRGLSYLRNYTHNHLHSPTSTSTSSQPPSSPPPLNRSTSSPARSRASEPRPRDQPTPSQVPSQTPSQVPAANGWVPTVGGQNGLSSVATQHESTTTDSSNPAMTRTRAQTTTTSENRPVSPRSVSANVLSSTTAPISNANTNTNTNVTTSSASPAQPVADKKQESPTVRLIPHHEPRSTRPSLTFPIVTRTLSATGQRVKIGRYSERDQSSNDAQNSSKTSNPVGFKSKVVSRRHCELWCDNGQWFIKDVKSSSGTFLNHVRLSSPGMESRPYPVNDGDIIQLGIDFKGGEEVIFRCVKIRIECNRGWQKSLNQFNTSTHKQLLRQAKAIPSKDSDAQSTHSSECSICLNPVAPCQALFVAPCSHVWHYKCIRSLIYPAWPSFQCPNCRAYADLEADVEPPEEEYDSTDDALEDALKQSETDADGRQKTSQEPSALAQDESDEHEDVDLTAMMNSVSVRSSSPSPNPSATESSSDGEAGPSQASTSQPMPIMASTNAPINKALPDSIMARSATPTSSTPFALAATAGLLVEGQNTPRNDAGPFLVDHSRRSNNADGIARESVQEEAEEHT